MMIKACRALLPLVMVLVLVGCGRDNKAMRLRKHGAVYVPLKPVSLLSLEEALAAKGYGEVRMSDLRPSYIYLEVDFQEGRNNALVAYSSEEDIPSGTSYRPMSVVEFYQLVVSDPHAEGAVLNPDGQGRNRWVVPTGDIIDALPRLPRQVPLSGEIRIRK